MTSSSSSSSSSSTPHYPSFSTQNFYSGSQLNRLSWLRTDSSFLNSALTSSSSKFILLENLNPLTHSSNNLLATVSWEQIKETVLKSAQLSGGNHENGFQIFGPNNYNLNGSNLSDSEKSKLDKVTQGLTPSNLAIAFLGVDETQLGTQSLPGELAIQDQPSTSSSSSETQVDNRQAPAGTPYFAISLTYKPPNQDPNSKLPTQELLEKLNQEGSGYAFTDARSLAAAGTWKNQDAALVAQARSLIDWNERNVYCPACSRRQYSLWAGYKRGCSSGLAGTEASSPEYLKPFLQESSFKEDGKGECPSTKMLSNYCYPRTDPVVIMAILSSDQSSILLGRQKKWPASFYSCLAGFIEPGESFEEAVRREVVEESGLKVSEVIYHSSQNWPFPAQLMMGAIGIVEKGQEDKIRLDLDNELEKADWFSREEVLEVLKKTEGAVMSKKDLKKFDDNHTDEGKKSSWDKSEKKWNEKDQGSVANVESGNDEVKENKPKFKIPGATAIAHVLIAAWARGDAIVPTNSQDWKKLQSQKDASLEVGKGRM